MPNLPRRTTIVAGVAGLLWTVKVLVITLRDGSFNPVEAVVFLTGLACVVAACVLVALHVTRHRRGVTRVAAGAGVALALFLTTVLLEGVGKGMVGGLSSGDNLGLEEEGGILFAGLAWFALAAVSTLRRRDDRAAAGQGAVRPAVGA